MTPEAWTFCIFLVGTLCLLGLVMGTNVTLQEAVRRANRAALDADRKAKRDRAEAAQLRKSNETLRRHTTEHCHREAVLRTLLAVHGIKVEDVTLADLDAAQSPADIRWGEPR